MNKRTTRSILESWDLVVTDDTFVSPAAADLAHAFRSWIPRFRQPNWQVLLLRTHNNSSSRKVLSRRRRALCPPCQSETKCLDGTTHYRPVIDKGRHVDNDFKLYMAAGESSRHEERFYLFFFGYYASTNPPCKVSRLQQLRYC